MKKKSIAALACSVSFSLTVSADSSYTYTAGDTSLGDGAVVITYAEGTTDIATLTATPIDGGTITLMGAAPSFAADATITLASSGTVAFASKVSTLGALSLERSDNAYLVWTGTALTESNKKTGNYATAFDNGNIVAADLEPTSVVYVATGSECPGRFDRYVSGPGSNIFTINRVNADHSYTIRPQIGTDGLRCITASRSQRFGYYPSTSLWSNKNAKGIDRGYWTGTTYENNGERLGTVSALGLTKIFAARKGATMAQVRFDGGAALGGETAVAVGVEAVLAVPEGDNFISNAFTGDGDVRIVPMAPTTAYAGTAYLEPWITTSWQIIATNRSLSALTSLAGKMQGGSHSPSSTTGGDACTAYHLTSNPVDNTVDCQFQLESNGNNKIVLAKLRQNGANVEIRAIKAGRVAVATYPVGTDLTDVTLTSAGLATSASTSGYGIHMITAAFAGASGMGCVTLDGSMNAMVGNQLTFEGGDRPLYVTVTSETAFPTYGNVNVLTNADVKLHVTSFNVGGGVSGGTSTLKVKRGGVLRRNIDGQIAKPQQVEVDGGTLIHGGAGVYLNYLLLKDGARMTSSSVAPRSAYDNTRSYYNVVGTEPSSIEGSGIRPYGNTSASSVSRIFQINVNDVTGNDGIDCTLAGIQAVASTHTYYYYHFEKYGDGTLKLEGSGKHVRCQTRLYGGTFILGASNSMTNEVILAGGSLAVDAGTSNALGSLTVSNACTIAVGKGGALSFKSFTAGEDLAAKSIIIDAPLTGDVLKIDSTLPREEYKYFRWKDDTVPTKLWKVKQNANGYLHPFMSGITISIL